MMKYNLLKFITISYIIALLSASFEIAYTQNPNENPLNNIFKRTAVGYLTIGEGKITDPNSKKYGIYIRFRDRLNPFSYTKWTLTEGEGDNIHVIMSGRADQSFDPRSNTVTINLISDTSSAAILSLVKPNFSGAEFKKGLLFIRPEYRQKFYTDLKTYFTQSHPVNSIFQKFFEQLNNQKTGRIENIDTLTFGKIGRFGYAYIILQ